MSIGGVDAGVPGGGASARTGGVWARRDLCALALALGALAQACSYGSQTAPVRSGGTPALAPAPPTPAQVERTERGGGPPGAPPVAQPPGRENDGTTQLAGTSNPAPDHTPLTTHNDECTADRDCACGVDRATGACALGPVTRIDPGVQCPDFCMGITGVLHIACERGRCVQQTAR